jgi:hypothetical protein
MAGVFAGLFLWVPDYASYSVKKLAAMNTKEASVYLKEVHGIVRSPATLTKLRCVGGGPAFRKAGRQVILEQVHLDEWAAELLSRPVRSTSELLVDERQALSPEGGNDQPRPR